MEGNEETNFLDSWHEIGTLGATRPDSHLALALALAECGVVWCGCGCVKLGGGVCVGYEEGDGA